MAAYARHGRQPTARFSSSRELRSLAARSKPRSPAGNASGSPKARMETYCAVQAPIPGRSQKRPRNSSTFTTPVNAILPLQTACAKERMQRARALGSPILERSLAANFSGVGKICVSPWLTTTGVPNARTSLPDRVVAPATVTCWPRMARTASSNPSQQPGIRRPGRDAIRLASMGSRRK